MIYYMHWCHFGSGISKMVGPKNQGFLAKNQHTQRERDQLKLYSFNTINAFYDPYLWNFTVEMTLICILIKLKTIDISNYAEKNDKVFEMCHTDTRGCFPKFANGLNIKIGIV